MHIKAYFAQIGKELRLSAYQAFVFKRFTYSCSYNARLLPTAKSQKVSFHQGSGSVSVL